MAIESEGTNNLLSELQRDVEMSRGNTSVEKLVLKYGRSFNPVTRPKGIRQRAAKACFKNSLLVADAGRAFYVEGFAMKTSLGRRSTFRHAWSTRDGINAFDTTLKDNSDCLYLGVAIPTKLVWEKWFKTDGTPFLDARKSFEEIEALLQRALSSPLPYDVFKQTAK
jgi:hypothetical protein